MNESPRCYPRRIRSSNAEFELRLMSGGDAAAALAFAATLPPHDLLFLQRDIRNPKVVAAWLEQIERGMITSLLAVADGKICGCAAIVRDTLSWSPHVGDAYGVGRAPAPPLWRSRRRPASQPAARSKGAG